MQPSRLVALFALLCSLVVPAFAQCVPEWDSANPPPQLSGVVFCSTQWDPDGAGPELARMVVGGFNLSGGTIPPGSRIGVFDGAHWSGLGSGPGTPGASSGQSVLSLAVWNGFLVAGGDFTGGGTDRIAMWNGATWQPLGGGLPGSVTKMALWNGNLVAAGFFGSTSVVQMWNGGAWSALPPPPNVSGINAMTEFQGHLCLGCYRIAASPSFERWNGSAWAPSITVQGGSGILCFAVQASLAVGGTPILYAGGDFTTIGGVAATGIAKTSGGAAFAWSAVGNNSQQDCRSLHVRPNGQTGFTVIASFPNISAPRTSRYSSASPTWTTIGPAMTSLLYSAGSYYGVSQGVTGTWNRYDGTSWLPVLGDGLVGQVRTCVATGNDVVVAGAFQATTGTPLGHIVRWDGTTFQTLGSGITGTGVDAVYRRANGDLFAGGLFTAAGGTPASNIARWTGSTWAALGAGTNQQVRAVCELPNGDIIAGGSFTTAGGVACNRIARWNGTTWSPLNFGFNGDVLAVAVRADGTLFAAGSFTAAGATTCNRIAQWNGSTWQPLGTGCDADVHALAFRPNGELVAVGAFTTAGGVTASRCALWNGTTWASMGFASSDPAPARSVCVLPDGDVVVGRGFQAAGTPPDSGIARWNGSTWSSFGSGLAATTAGTSVDVRAIVQRADGTLVVGGAFGVAGGIPALGLATLTPPCAPAVASYGAGCSSGVGPLVLTADALPWIGSTFRTTTAGIAANSLCVGAIGFSTLNLPLAALLPEGQPGCTLLASADIPIVLTNGAAGTAQSQFALPDATALVGTSFVQQTIPLEFGAAGLTAVRGSNGLSMTIGML